MCDAMGKHVGGWWWRLSTRDGINKAEVHKCVEREKAMSAKHRMKRETVNKQSEKLWVCVFIYISSQEISRNMNNKNEFHHIKVTYENNIWYLNIVFFI